MNLRDLVPDLRPVVPPARDVSFGRSYLTKSRHISERRHLEVAQALRGRVLAEQWEWNIDFGPITQSTFHIFYRYR